jgi:uncharacterized protein (TIGR02421 family)
MTAPADTIPLPPPPERLGDTEVDRLRQAAKLLRKAERPVRILRAVAWGPEVAERFFAAGAMELPKVTYTPLDPTPVREGVAAARALVTGSSPVHAWLNRVADVIVTGAEMLAALGTKDFHRHSVTLYGSPQTELLGCDVRPLDLAHTLDSVLGAFADLDVTLGDTDPPTFTADELAARMRLVLEKMLREKAPEVQVVPHLSAKALAGSNYIRLRGSAIYSDRDLTQLIQHEALVHVATSLNGAAQEHFPILASGHAGTTRTQEGLAVFAELISGAMDPSRLMRLADRVIAIQMAMDGADFLQLYRYFSERTHTAAEAFENARRVVRGGVLTGGGPFTKDSCYLEGLVKVHNFLRIAVQETRVDCIRLLFAGKLDIEDMPAMTMLAAHGLCTPPRFLPPWARDLRFLLSYIAYSSFLNRMHLEKVREHYKEMLSMCVQPGSLAH